MKNLIYLFALLFSTSTMIAQEVEPDTTRINVGHKEVIIIDKGGDLEIITDSIVGEWDNYDDDDDDRMSHWGGIDMGINIWMDADGKSDFEGDDIWLDQDYWHSFSWDLNLIEKKIKIVDDYVGIATGLGLSYKSYGLSDSTVVMNRFNTVDGNGNPITIDSTYGVASDLTFSKNKLRTSALKLPVLLEFNTSKNPDKNFHVSAGVIGGWNFKTMVKNRYEVDNHETTNKTKGNYSVNDFTLDAQVRVGYNNFTVFATYGLTPFFEDNKGPEIYTATIGIALIPF